MLFATIVFNFFFRTNVEGINRPDIPSKSEPLLTPLSKGLNL